MAQPADKFPLFSHFPAEIQLHIWRSAYTPRILHVNVHTSDCSDSVSGQKPRLTMDPRLRQATAHVRNVMGSCRAAYHELSWIRLPARLPVFSPGARKILEIPFDPENDLICCVELGAELESGSCVNDYLPGPPKLVGLEWNESGSESDPHWTTHGPRRTAALMLRFSRIVPEEKIMTLYVVDGNAAGEVQDLTFYYDAEVSGGADGLVKYRRWTRLPLQSHLKAMAREVGKVVVSEIKERSGQLEGVEKVVIYLVMSQE